jgi:hypothetical protein
MKTWSNYYHWYQHREESVVSRGGRTTTSLAERPTIRSSEAPNTVRNAGWDAWLPFDQRGMLSEQSWFFGHALPPGGSPLAHRGSIGHAVQRMSEK